LTQNEINLSDMDVSQTQVTDDSVSPAPSEEISETVSDTSDDITSLNEKLAAEKEKILRLSAEFDNYKKRKQRETDDYKKFANESVFKQLLSVVDNLERAISSAEDSPGQKLLLEGVKLIHKEVLKVFESFHVIPVNPENHPFDLNLHQAVLQEESDSVPANTVLRVLQKGYVIHDRLIRPAMVIVSKQKSDQTSDTSEI
jgi:molecular chaperone GrpE